MANPKDDEIVVVELKSRPALTIAQSVKGIMIAKAMSNAFPKIKSHIESQGLKCIEGDMPFCIYHDIDWEQLRKKGPIAIFKVMFTHKWNLEMGLPTPERMEAGDGMKSTELPAGRFIKVIHLGPYMNVDEAYARVRAYAAEQKLSLQNYTIEVYANDPTTVPKEEIRTEVYVPFD